MVVVWIICNDDIELMAQYIVYSRTNLRIKFHCYQRIVQKFVENVKCFDFHKYSFNVRIYADHHHIRRTASTHNLILEVGLNTRGIYIVVIINVCDEDSNHAYQRRVRKKTSRRRSLWWWVTTKHRLCALDKLLRNVNKYYKLRRVRLYTPDKRVEYSLFITQYTYTSVPHDVI